MLGRLSRAQVEPTTDNVRITLLNDYGHAIGTIMLTLASDSGRSDAFVTKLNLAREIARRINGDNFSQ
jgi:hypothetical protein